MLRRVRIWIFPTIALLLATSIIVGNWRLLTTDSGAVARLWLYNFTQGQIGPGQVNNYDHGWPELDLQPGDIVLGGYPGCSYGRYTHVALYAGHDEVIEAFMDIGVCRQSIQHFRTYNYIAVLRPALPAETINAALAYAQAQCGEIFFPLAFNADERYWNCSKLIWKAYAQQGEDFNMIGDLWINPQDFIRAPQLELIYEN